MGTSAPGSKDVPNGRGPQHSHLPARHTSNLSGTSGGRHGPLPLITLTRNCQTPWTSQPSYASGFVCDLGASAPEPSVPLSDRVFGLFRARYSLNNEEYLEIHTPRCISPSFHWQPPLPETSELGHEVPRSWTRVCLELGPLSTLAGKAGRPPPRPSVLSLCVTSISHPSAVFAMTFGQGSFPWP